MRGCCACALPMVLIGSFAAILLTSGRMAFGETAPGPGELSAEDRETLRRYARDTWRTFAALEVPGGLPADGLVPDDSGGWKTSSTTSPTDIGAYLWSVLAAQRLGLVEPAEAAERLERTLKALARADRLKGFFFDRLDPRNGRLLTESQQTGEPVRALLSAVDNAWLAAALMMVKKTQPALA